MLADEWVKDQAEKEKQRQARFPATIQAGNHIPFEDEVQAPRQEAPAVEETETETSITVS